MKKFLAIFTLLLATSVSAQFHHGHGPRHYGGGGGGCRRQRSDHLFHLRMNHGSGYSL